ncbi:MAG TPA: type II toxin-antitoxin system RelE/ParE family toxin [Tepidisphaeraceae bacterium]|nr:type II toxin-antitoxin system RelE/ParE family toxin [Tepidisphaeraceae bacterium]
MNDPYRLIIAPRAAFELAQIHDYIAKRSPQAATTMVTRILDGLERLCEVPHRTQVLSQPLGLKHPVRSLAIGPYLIYFRALDSERVVRVLRIRHGARRQPRKFD